MTQRLVLYHADCVDGFTAAWAAYCRWGYDRTTYVPVQHGEKAPSPEGREVWILDFNYPRDVLVRMEKESSALRVLDHHKSAAEDLAGLPFVTFDLTRSGAGLAWDVLCAEPRPWLIDYVEDRDLWRFKLAHSRDVTAWIGTRPKTFEEWDRLMDGGMARARKSGEGVQAYVDMYVREMAKHARMGWLGGQLVPIINAPGIGISELLGHLAKGHPFAAGWSQRGDGRYTYSLRSDGGFDVSGIARAHGGGGNPSSAGFDSFAIQHDEAS